MDLETGTFDGRGAYIEVPASDLLQLGRDDFTFSAWVHTETIVDDTLGDVLSWYDPKLRRGVTLSLQASAGGYQSIGDDRHVCFGIDNAKLSGWQDCGQPKLQVPLPEIGLIQFFLGIDEPASNIVHEVHYRKHPGGDLSRPSPPDEEDFLNEECTLFKPVGLRFRPSVSLPQFYRDRTMDEFADQLEELRGKLESPSSPRKPSQLLGHPLAISGDPLIEAYVAVHGHPNIIYSLHQKLDEVDRDLAAAQAAGDEKRIAWMTKQKASMTWLHENRSIIGVRPRTGSCCLRSPPIANAKCAGGTPAACCF